ncbi:hypothetical protein [Nonomuraea sp. NPDC050783]|uniref:hypothetical protein n=1 Tax=Nonomuraea sp. NPDC050783 TaxID=3154634 RepID=UPI0034655F25
MLCGIAGVVLFVGGIVGSVNDLAPTRTFAPGESVTVAADPADKPAVYISTDTPVNYTCQISGGSGQAKLAKTTGTQTVTVNGARWEQILVVNAPAKGDYTLTCANQESATVRYGVGKPLSSAAGGIVGGTAALLGIPGAGVLVAIVVTVVVLMRRSSARRRLAVAG